MRTEALLSILIVALAFASGALIISIKSGPVLGLTAPILAQAIQKFTDSTPALDYFKSESLSEALDPRNALPFYFRFSYQEVQDLVKFSNSCHPTKSKRSASLLKTWQWQEFACNHRKLSEDFFSHPPFFHPEGHSFAYLAKKNSEWAKAHLNLFHVSELRELSIADLPAPYLYLSFLDFNAMNALVAEEKLAITNRYVFVDSNNEMGYAVYPRTKWDAYWATTPFLPHPDTNSKNCFVKEKSICWSYDIEKAFFPKWNPLIFLLGFIVLLAIFISILLAARVSRRQKDQLRMKFTLEMLAHEIRTPAANLALTVESFRSKFDRFPEDTKTGLLRLFDQIERIKRVAESSKNYLNNHSGADLIRTNFSEINSIKDFMHHVLDAYLSQIELEIYDQPTSLILDPYWTSVCITNLVENAIVHGIKPVRVIIRQKEKTWTIIVSDQGSQIFDPMSKGERSSGFGLGFKLVKTILPRLHAHMKMTHDPTSIQIFFGEIK